MHSPRRSARPRRPVAADEVHQPAGKIAAGDVAVAGGTRPARHQPQRRGVGGARLQAACRLLVIQQAEIVLAPLADDGLLRLAGAGRIEPVELAVDLMLQIAGIGADPDRAVIALGPEARGRDIAQRLAHAGAGLGQDELRLALAQPRREGRGDRRGIIGLLRARLGAFAQQLGQAPARLARLDRLAAGRRGRGVVLPFRQLLPDIEAAAMAAGRLQPQCGDHRRAPGPIAPGHGPGDAGKPRVGRRRLELGQQPAPPPDAGSPPRPRGRAAAAGRGPRRGRGAWAGRSGPAARRRRAPADRRRRSARCRGAWRWPAHGRGSGASAPRAAPHPGAPAAAPRRWCRARPRPQIRRPARAHREAGSSRRWRSSLCSHELPRS